MLLRLGLLLPNAAPDESVVVEILASLMPHGSEIAVCTDYIDLTSTATPRARKSQGRFLRPLPPTLSPGLGFGRPFPTADGFAGLRPTRMVLCTQDVLFWTDSRLAEADGVVIEELVSAYSIPFAEILGAKARRKGNVDIWVEDGPTLTFRVQRDEATGLSAHVEAAAESA